MSQTVRVHQTTWLASGVVRIEFRHPEGAALPRWEPGAHLSLQLPNGLVREYSLCGDPADPYSWTVAVLHEPSSRGGSSWVHERLTAGTLIEVDGPRNNFPLEQTSKVFLIAGGIGVTPVLPMARELGASDADWQMLYCGRSRSSMAFLPELTEFAGERLRVHADDDHGGPPELSTTLAGLEPDTLVYCCGPEPLIQAVEAALPERSALCVERFSAPQQQPATDVDDEFTVLCESSGSSVRVEPGTSILDALGGAGVGVPSSCREGICGTCETKVLGGTPDHRDFVLSDAEKEAGDTMLVCVSRCRSPELRLDL